MWFTLPTLIYFWNDSFYFGSSCEASREMGLGKKIPNLARGWLRWWWSGQDFHSNVINFGSGLEHSFAFLILNVPIWPKSGKWFPHEILPLIGEMVRKICTTMPCPNYSSVKLFLIWSFLVIYISHIRAYFSRQTFPFLSLPNIACCS